MTIVYIYAFATKFTRDITVKGDFVNRMSNIIATESGDIYKIENNALMFRFNSAKLLAELEVGKTYRVKGYGIRINFFGVYPTITEVL